MTAAHAPGNPTNGRSPEWRARRPPIPAAQQPQEGSQESDGNADQDNEAKQNGQRPSPSPAHMPRPTAGAN